MSNTTDSKMTIESEITGSIARSIREKLGLSQPKFWPPIGVKQSVGCRYEGGFASIPKSVRILIVARYISGIRIDTETLEGVEELKQLGSIQAKNDHNNKMVASVGKHLKKAITIINDANEALQAI